jgi:VanZ family protein
MGSSSLVYSLYAPQTSAERRVRMQRWMQTWLPVLACVMVFVIESTSYFGADRTSAPLQRMVEAIFGYDVCAHWDVIHYFIRKTGHFMGYGIFSLVCFRGFWITLQSATSRLPRQLRAHGLAILATFLVASADEFHQSFLPNRSGQFSDVLLDSSGAVVLGLAIFLTMLAAERRRRSRTSTGRCLEPAYVGKSVY